MLKYILSSSNENKIKEFKTILGNKLTIQKVKCTVINVYERTFSVMTVLLIIKHLKSI